MTPKSGEPTKQAAAPILAFMQAKVGQIPSTKSDNEEEEQKVGGKLPVAPLNVAKLDEDSGDTKSLSGQNQRSSQMDAQSQSKRSVSIAEPGNIDKADTFSEHMPHELNPVPKKSALKKRAVSATGE